MEVRLPTKLWRNDPERRARWEDRRARAASSDMGDWAQIEALLLPLVAQQVEVLRGTPAAERLRLGREAAESLPLGGTEILFDADPALIADLARVLAVLSYQPAGCFVFGRRWYASDAPQARKSTPREVDAPEAEACTTCRDYDWRTDVVCPDCRAGECLR